MMLSDVCLTFVAYIGPKSRTERPRKTKIGTHVTRTPLSRSKGKLVATAGLTNVGAPSPPRMPSSRDYVFNFIIKYKIDKDLDNKLDF